MNAMIEPRRDHPVNDHSALQDFIRKFGAMTNHRQFMLYKLVPDGAKTLKKPCSIAGQVVNPHDPQYWVDAATAYKAAERLGMPTWGVAFVLTDDDDFFFIDIDNALHDGHWSPIAVELCERFAGALVEVSQSQRGLHILGTGKPSIDEYACKAKDPVTGSKSDLFDLYVSERFIALTGNTGDNPGNPATTHQAALDYITEKWLKLDASESGAGVEWTTTHHVDAKPIEDDAALIEKALKSESVAGSFGARATFAQLWNNDTAALLEHFPSDQGGDHYDASAADLALCQHLCFWTGNNAERILRLLNMSGLKRDKWSKRPEYLVRRTIPKAMARQTVFYTGGKQSVEAPTAPMLQTTDSVSRTGFQYLSGNHLADYFRGCVYVTDEHRVLMPNGMLLKAEQFNALKGGFSFQLDSDGSKTTKKAFEAFTESQCYNFPKVDMLSYDPSRPFGLVYDEQGISSVNAFYYRPGERVAGDVSWFTAHMTKLLPVKSDRETLLDWMAYKVQNPGECMRWSPVLVGSQGNGKSTVADLMMYAVGKNHCAVPQSNDLGNKFNAWVYGNVFAVINDFKVGDKRDIMEVLKPILTDETISVQMKGKDVRTIKNHLGIMITTNHPDGVVKDEADRRYAVFMTAQQHPEDLSRDGMDGAYFSNIRYHINNGGRAAVAYMLANRVVASVPHVAPRTSSHDAAIEASRSPAQACILQHIEDGTSGFRGDIVIGCAAREALEMEGIKAPARALGSIMSEIGYAQHTGLPGGRAKIIGKMRTVFVKRGSLITYNVTQGPTLAQMSGFVPGGVSSRINEVFGPN